MKSILWHPPKKQVEQSLITHFMQSLPNQPKDYHQLYEWSVDNMEEFWKYFWEFSEIKYSKTYDSILENPVMPGAKWFSGSMLNYAENLLSGDPKQTAVINTGEDRADQYVNFAQLNQMVAEAQLGLEKLGLKDGVRVAAFVPNCLETLVLMLATTASGGIWTSCSPDFGAHGVIDRFSQVQPQILIIANGYRYNGKIFTLEQKANETLSQIDSIKHVVLIHYIDVACQIKHPSVLSFESLIDNDAVKPNFIQLPFDHPLFIMYSSGTTGPPKSIVHSIGGTLIQHLKEHKLQCDVHAGKDIFFWFTTCGWMMWNWLVSALASGATIVLYDGSPGYPNLESMWKLVEKHKITHFGTSPKFLSVCEHADLIPKDIADLSSVKSVLSTGAPLVPELFDWIYENIDDHIQLISMSGGTDLLGCFLGGSPILPVYRGELQCRQLAMDVQAWNAQGESIIGEHGELVCVQPFPSMPLGFLNDTDGKKYQAAYFEENEGVWTHGDFIEITKNGGGIMFGRSDTTLNPGGIRIGTAEIYRALEPMHKVLDSIVVGRPNKGDVDVVLFVKLNIGIELNVALDAEIRKIIRKTATPRHVPKFIFSVQDIPYTMSRKKVEKAVLYTLTGREIPNLDALINPECLKEYALIKFED